MELYLKSIDGHDQCPERRLRLTMDTPVKVGRSSKTGARNVQPARSNAFIDSPVISREHAKFTLEHSVYSESPNVYITDTGSMHGTYINKEKIKEHTPVKLQNGLKLTFGAFVFRNSETFPAREYEVSLRRSIQTNDTGTPGTFKVPDGESSEEESYASSQMEESDAESDSSAPEVFPLLRSGNDDGTHLKEVKPAGARDVIPDSMEQNASYMSPSEEQAVLLKSSDNAIKENRADSLSGGNPPIGADIEQSMSPVYIPMPPDSDKDQDAIRYTEVPESRPVSSSPAPGSFDGEQQSDVESSGIRARSMSVCSDDSTGCDYLDDSDEEEEEEEDDDDDEDEDDDDDVVIQDSHDHQPQNQVPTNKAIPESAGLDLRDNAGYEWSSANWYLSQKNDQGSAPIPNEANDTTTIPLDFAVQAAAIDATEGKSRLTQSMSLERIMDGPSKNAPASNSNGIPPYGRTPGFGRAEAVTVESLLNFSPLPSDAQGYDYRAWRPASASSKSQPPMSIVPPSVQQSHQERSGPLWGAPGIESVIEEGPFINTQTYAQFRSCNPLTVDYQSQPMFRPENDISFDVNDMEGAEIFSYYPTSQVDSKEAPKAKTSISISDIVDNNPPANGQRSAQKRKADVLEEEVHQEMAVTEGLADHEQGAQETSQDSRSNLTRPISPLPESHSVPVEATNPPPKRRRLHPGSFLAGTVMGGIGVFAALVFLPESAFQ